MKMSKTLQNYLAAIQHNVNGGARNPKIRFAAYKLILRENFGMLPAQRQLEAAVELNYPPALVELAVLFLNGQYIEKTEDGFQAVADSKRAIKFLKKAADMGDPQACLLLAACYCKGIGCSQSEIEAERYISQIDGESLRQIFGNSEEGTGLCANLLKQVVYLLGVWPIPALYAGIKKEEGE